MNILKIFLILVLVWYAIKLIFRYVIPKVVLNFLKRKGFAPYEEEEQPEEGEVKIKVNRAPSGHKDDDDFGEYVDFEEIKPEENTENEK